MCTEEERKNMVSQMRKSGRLRTIVVVFASAVAILVGLWGLTANLNATISGSFDTHAERVFEKKLNEFHEVAQPKIMQAMDNRIAVHKLQSEIDLQKELEAMRLQQHTNTLKLDEILRRLPE